MDPRSEHTGKQDTIQVSVGGCSFVGTLYEISGGNCSLYLSRRQSDFPRLPLDSITWLRRSADSLGEIYVDQVECPTLSWVEDFGTGDPHLASPLVKSRACRRLREWITVSLPVEYGAGDRLRELGWLVDDFVERFYYFRHWNS
jgi:hypothetical protein